MNGPFGHVLDVWAIILLAFGVKVHFYSMQAWFMACFVLAGPKLWKGKLQETQHDPNGAI